MKWLFAGHPMQLVLGYSLWLAWFTVIYGGMSVACSVAPPGPAQGPFNYINGVLLALTLATTAALAWASRACWRTARQLPEGEEARRARFVARAGAWLHGAAAVSTLVTGLPLLAFPPCL